MDNVETLHTQKPAAFNEESELYFDVWERPAYFMGKRPTDVTLPHTQAKFYEDPHHKHIVRMWKDEPCSIA